MNPARCNHCAEPIAAPMVTGNIYYYEYPGSVIIGRAGLPSNLGAILLPPRTG